MRWAVPVAVVAAVALLGVVSGVAAALVPAVQAARQNTAQVLAGRRSEIRDRPGRPLLGLLLVAAGVVVAVGTARSERWILAGAALGLLGLVALMPWLVRQAGRAAAWLSLPLRLSVRDAAHEFHIPDAQFSVSKYQLMPQIGTDATITAVSGRPICRPRSRADRRE